MNDSNDTKIAVLQNQMNNIEKKVDDGFADAKLEIAKLSLQIDDFIKSADERYAPKWAADGIKLVLGAIVLAVLAAVLAVIIKKPI